MNNHLFTVIAKYIPNTLAIKTRVEGECLIMMNQSGVIDVVNETAKSFFFLCDGKRTIGDIFDIMKKEYDVDEETLAADLLLLIRQMQKRGFIHIEELI